jgi:thiamine pyrophosphate-dependent acetolactate synthase large subunit-like protein
VYIQFNLDVLYPFPHVKKELDKRGSNWYLDYYIKNLFAAGFDVGREIRPWPIEIPFPKKEQVAKAVKTITKSERPLIILGSQASLPPIDDSKVRSILQEMGIPAFFEGTGRGILNRSSPLYLKHGLEEALEGSDLVLVLGVPGDFKAKRVSSKTQVIAVNRNKAVLKANGTQFSDHATSIHSDVGQFLVEVSEKLGRFAISEQWLADSKRRSEDGEKAARQASPVASIVDDVLPENTIIVSDSSAFSTSMESVLGSKGVWLESPAAAKLGAVAGYALGTKLAKSDSTVVALLGPSSLGYSLSELATAAISTTAIIALVGNDGSSKSVVDPSTGASYTEYEKAAETLGAKGLTVSAKDTGALNTTLEQAVQVAKEGRPVLVNLKL